MEAILSTNEINNFSVSELNYIRDSIENMNKFNQVEVLRILKKHNDVTINENKFCGVFKITNIKAGFHTINYNFVLVLVIRKFTHSKYLGNFNFFL